MSAPAFIFRPEHRFWWPVTVRYPGDGEMIEATFRAEFMMIDEDELVASARDDATEPKSWGELIAQDRARLSEVWTGWQGIGTEGGGELEFTHENRADLLERRDIRIAVGKAYAEAMYDQRSGNSAAPPA